MSATDHDILMEAVENTTEAFVTIDQEHRVVFFNRAAEKMFGYARQEVLGRDLALIMTADCSRDHRAAVARYLQTRVPSRIGHATELTAVRRDGSRFTAEISFSVSEAAGRVFFTGIVRDRTEVKTLLAQIRQKERLAAMGQVVAEIAHEIKNPLMLIGGFARQLEPQIADAKGRQKLAIIQKEVQRLEALLEEMRGLYLPRALKIETVDINALLREIAALIRPDCERQGITLRLDIPAEALLVTGDRSRTQQALLNLAKNAMEAMTSGGTLSLTAAVKEQNVEIAIVDTGCGIPEEDQDRIFTPFFTTKSRGSGLGLSVTKRIVEEHQGCDLKLSSQRGKGTSVTLTMPLAAACPQDAPAA